MNSTKISGMDGLYVEDLGWNEFRVSLGNEYEGLPEHVRSLEKEVAVLKSIILSNPEMKASYEQMLVVKKLKGEKDV